ncbi:MAG TPA: hypothetical protein VML50_06320 [Anaeromyxobacter sp.]|nr:hypothetical protein [Anaeromyxobacter sp.]
MSPAVLALTLAVARSEPAPPPPEADPAPEAGAARAALAALEEEDVALAHQALGPFEPLDRAGAAVRFAGGVLRFFEGRYPEAVALLASAGATETPEYGMAQAALRVTLRDQRVETEHFAVWFPPDAAPAVPPLLGALDAQRRALRPLLGELPAGRLRVELVGKPGEVAALAGLAEQDVVRSGAVGAAKFGKLVLLAPEGPPGDAWLDAAAHELTHTVITARTRNRAPVWLQEGLATWLEGSWRGRGGALSPRAEALVARAGARGRLMELREMHPSLARLSFDRAALAQAEAALAVEYLSRRAGAASIAELLERVGAGADAEEVAAGELGLGPGGFAAGWRRYLDERALSQAGRETLRRLGEVDGADGPRGTP